MSPCSTRLLPRAWIHQREVDQLSDLLLQLVELALEGFDGGPGLVGHLGIRRVAEAGG